MEKKYSVSCAPYFLYISKANATSFTQSISLAILLRTLLHICDGVLVSLIQSKIVA